MNCIHCEIRMIETDCTRTCPNCGIEKQIITNCLPGYHQAHAPLKRQGSYSRQYRFHTLIYKILGLSSGYCKNDIWKYLGDHAPYESILNLKIQLSKLDQKLKRYDMLPVFARYFCPTHVPKQKPSSVQVRTALLLFNRLEQRWKQVNTKRFFSYMFLIEKILQKVGLSEFIPLSKSLVCARRRKYYTEWLEKLGGLTMTWRLEHAELADAEQFADHHVHRGKLVDSPQHDNHHLVDIDLQPSSGRAQLLAELGRGGMLNTNALHADRVSVKFYQQHRAHEVDLCWNHNLKGLLQSALKTAS